MCRRLKPLLVFFSWLSTHLYMYLHLHLRYSLLLAILSYSPPKTARNPRQTRTGHTLKFPSDQIPTGATHVIATRQICYDSCIGLIGFRDGGISFRCTTCTECGRYTILYYIIPYTLYLHLTHSTHSYVCLMYEVYSGIEREKMEKRVRVSTYRRLSYHIRLLLLLVLCVAHYKDMISSSFPSILFDSQFPPISITHSHVFYPLCSKRTRKKKQKPAVSHYIIHEQNHATLRQPLPPSHQPQPAPSFPLHKTFPC